MRVRKPGASPHLARLSDEKLVAIPKPDTARRVIMFGWSQVRDNQTISSISKWEGAARVLAEHVTLKGIESPDLW